MKKYKAYNVKPDLKNKALFGHKLFEEQRSFGVRLSFISCKSMVKWLHDRLY